MEKKDGMELNQSERRGYERKDELYEWIKKKGEREKEKNRIHKRKGIRYVKISEESGTGG